MMTEFKIVEDITLLESVYYRAKTGEFLDQIEKIVFPEFDVSAWAKSFNRPIVYCAKKPLDWNKSLVKVLLKRL